MTKNILLAATAASVMAFAGAASAHTLTFQTGPVAGAIDATETGGATSAYKLASEAKVPPGSANFALVDTLSGGNLPSGNVVLTINLTGATFASAVGAGAVTGATACTTFTSTLSSGGASGSTSVTFLISNSNPDCSALNMLLPITPGAGTATVTATLATEAGTPIDGLTASRNIVTRGSAFDVVFDAGIGAGALADTFATLAVTPVYTTFSTTGGHNVAPESATAGQLGTIRITVDTAQHADLTGGVFAAAAHVTDADTVVTGNFSAFDGAGGGATLGAAATMTATTATINNQQAALTAGAVPFIVTRETGGVIPSSTYSAQVTYTLDGTYYNQEGPASGALETIQRDGTNVIFPWMNSTSIQTVTGTTNLIRLGNVASTATGPVFAQVLNAASSASGYTAAPAPVQIAASIPANSELVVNTATLSTALGNWGRGDVQISIEAPSNSITARRYATLSNGSITEFNSGTVANDQNQLNVP